MRIILSRKGFDQSNGRMPSPILPDGTLLSIPINDKHTNIKYSDLHIYKKSFLDIRRELRPKSRHEANYTCHLDPDLRRDIYPRDPAWRPAFGQTGGALTELKNNQVGVGDLFLFFGWFRQTEWSKGQLRFVPHAPNLHIIFGYLQVGSMIERKEDVPQWLHYHPHYEHEWKNNCIFLASEHLSLESTKPGAGVLDMAAHRVLTKTGCTRSKWNLPDLFHAIPITHHKPDSWHADYFQSANQSQEFIFEATPEAEDWALSTLL